MEGKTLTTRANITHTKYIRGHVHAKGTAQHLIGTSAKPFGVALMKKNVYPLYHYLVVMC